MFSPEFAYHWLAGQSNGADTSGFVRDNDENLSPTQQEALDELAERVSTARSVV